MRQTEPTAEHILMQTSGEGGGTCSAGAYEGEGDQAVERRALAVTEELYQHDGGSGAYLEDLVETNAVELQAAQTKTSVRRWVDATGQQGSCLMLVSTTKPAYAVEMGRMALVDTRTASTKPTRRHTSTPAIVKRKWMRERVRG